MVNWLKGGKYRIKVLRILEEQPALPSELAKNLNISRVSVSRILRDLKQERLLEETVKRSRTRTYFLTKKGRGLLGEIK